MARAPRSTPQVRGLDVSMQVRGGPQLLRKLDNFALALPRANREGVEAAAMTVKVRVLRKVDRATGDRRLSGANNARLGVRYDVAGALGNPTAIVKATGPYQLGIEQAVKPHWIIARRLGSTRNQRAETTGQLNLASAVFAFGGTVRGIFGTLMSGAATYSRNGLLKTRTRSRALRIGDNWRAYAYHPGTVSPSMPWSRGIDDSRGHTTKAFERKVNDVIRKTFGA